MVGVDCRATCPHSIMDNCAAGNVNVLYTAVTRGMNIKKSRFKKHYLFRKFYSTNIFHLSNYFVELRLILKEKLTYSKTKPNSITDEKANH